MVSLQEFKSNIDKYGTARPSRYDILISGPNTPIVTSEISELLSTRCESANIPGIQIVTTNNKLYGGHPDFNIPNGRKHDEVQLTFLETEEYKIKYFFEEWHSKITDMKNGQISYYKDICKDIDIRMYSDKDNLTNSFVYEIKLIDAIPTRTEIISINWSDVDQLFKLTVNISCKDLQTKILKPVGVREFVSSTITF